MRNMLMRAAGLGALSAGLGALAVAALAQDAADDLEELKELEAASTPVLDAGDCGGLTREGLFADTEVTSAEIVPAGGGLPSYCEVTGAIRPVEGSEIGVVYRLPDEWNGKVLGIGGGGWMGNVTLEAATDGLTRGYATLQTDGGHANGTGFDASEWAIKPDGSYDRVKIEDFAHRAMHLMTERGKAVAYAYYGEPHDHALYLGCSTGGRQGLMEVQRYPEDYDGVVAGAPVYNFLTQTTQTLRSVAFGQEGARLQPEHLTLIQESSLAACDAADGAADGVLRDPRACGWDPAELLCEPGESGAGCLTEAQAAAVSRIYDGETMESGEIASYPISRGGEASWLFFVPSTNPGEPGPNTGGLHTFRGEVLGDAEFDMNEFSAEDVATVRESWMAGAYEANEADIAEFVDNGGKLLLWHGFNDPGPSALATVDYYEAVQDALGEDAESVRLFLAPGVDHCRGGAGPDQIDWLTAMEDWVETGAAPEEIPATKADSDLAWNVCSYPELPTGQGDGTYRCE